MRKSTELLIATLCFGAIAAHPAGAAPPGAPAEATDPAPLSVLGEALSEENLAGLNGRQDIQIDQINAQITDMNSNATSTGNNLSALNSTITTGQNMIGDAFANASGIVTVIQNSGNQVLIQNDMILNLWTK